MNFIYKLLLTFSQTSWLLSIYFVNNRITTTTERICAVVFPLLLTTLSLYMTRFLGRESGINIKDFSVAESDVHLQWSFLLLCCFVTLSIKDIYIMTVIYLIIFQICYKMQSYYFNPFFLFFGYHHYLITTEQGTKILLIKKGEVIRNTDVFLKDIRRINDTTFICK